MFLRVDRILRRVTSLPAAVAYYRDALGLGLIREEPTLAVLRLGDEITELVLAHGKRSALRGDLSCSSMT